MQHEPPPLPESPPTAAGEMPPPRRSWPTIMGVLLLVLAGLDTLGILGAIFSTIITMAVPPDPESPDAAIAQMQVDWLPLTILTTLGTIVTVVLLVIGSIRLLKRRPSARRPLLIWSVIKLILAVLGLLMLILGFASMQEAFDEQGAQGMPMGFFFAIGLVAGVFSFLWAAGPPAFVLYWLRRASIRDEIAAWNQHA